jgi:hypothetical protein
MVSLKTRHEAESLKLARDTVARFLGDEHKVYWRRARLSGQNPLGVHRPLSAGWM